ncbi:MAG: PaaI family thioesterase [Acidimicrobiia bacterium]
MRNLDRSLGDGGMPLLAQLGLSFERYGEGWAEATWTPTELACNPLGPVHGGVYAVVHDAAMNFATNSALERGDRSATLDLSYQTRRAASAGTALSVRGEVVQLTKSVAYVESVISDPENGDVVSKGMATFAVRRSERSGSAGEAR